MVEIVSFMWKRSLVLLLGWRGVCVVFRNSKLPTFCFILIFLGEGEVSILARKNGLFQLSRLIMMLPLGATGLLVLGLCLITWEESCRAGIDRIQDNMEVDCAEALSVKNAL